MLTPLTQLGVISSLFRIKLTLMLWLNDDKLLLPPSIQLGVISALFRIKLTLMLWLNEYKLLLGVENSLDFDDIDGICPSVALADFEGDFVAFI